VDQRLDPKRRGGKDGEVEFLNERSSTLNVIL
jgi:hypothetical protein